MLRLYNILKTSLIDKKEEWLIYNDIFKLPLSPEGHALSAVETIS